MSRLIVFLLLLGLLSACGTPGAGSDTTASPSAGADVPASPSAVADASDAPQPSAGPGEQQIVGIIDYYDDRTSGVVAAPTTVRAGETFEVTITTFGGGCERAGGADVRVEGLVATISVYDFTVAGPAVSCTAELKRLPRTVSLSFAEAGAAVIRIEGQRVASDTPGAPTTLEQPITVQ